LAASAPASTRTEVVSANTPSRADGERELGEQRFDILHGFAHPDAGDGRELLRHGAHELDFSIRRYGGEGRGDQFRVGRAFEHIG